MIAVTGICPPSRSRNARSVPRIPRTSSGRSYSTSWSTLVASNLSNGFPWERRRKLCQLVSTHSQTRDSKKRVRPRPFSRRLNRGWLGEVSPDRAADVIADLADLDLHRHPHLDLLARAWKLRANVTAYDAMYVALGEALGTPVVTCDAPLAKAPGRRAHVEVIT